MTDQTSWLPERVAAAEREVGGTFDLTECVQEPIHLLGGIQSYGALIAIQAGHIAVVSENAEKMLGLAGLSGSPATRLIDAAQLATLEGLADADTGQTAMMPVQTTVEAGSGRFDVTLHRSCGMLVLEFEPGGSAQDFPMIYSPIRQALMRLQMAGTVLEACRAAVREIRAITGYDRVVAYRFESDNGPGEVIAEDVTGDWEQWLGLWFPATDIPPQARRLYERNWIRVIADVDDETVRLSPPTLAETGAPLDLSMSVLRTVSPFHLEYLRNIQVRSSMSVSLLAGGKLWGLIACHGREVNALGPQVRSACEFFGVALSLHLAALQERDETGVRDRSRGVISRLLEGYSDGPVGTWPMDRDGLLGLIPCEAVAVRVGGEIAAHGAAPDPEALAALLAELPVPPFGEVWHTDRLAEDLPAAAALAPSVAGVLILPSGAPGDCIVWLRGERTVSRRWAADPDVPVTLGPHGSRLTPRGSTAVFLASVRGRATRWTVTDLAMAVELGRTVVGIAVTHARRVSALNVELTRSNVDLDSFAHAAAHDLKEPLRGIANTATFITEDAADGLDEVTARRLASIQRLAERMDELLNSLLYYSRLGRTELHRADLDLREAVLRAMVVAGPRLREAGVSVILPDRGVTVAADPVLFDQVLVNLLVNAAKYAHSEGPRRVTVSGGPDLMVRDNGIGMPPHLRQQAFQLFRRLHPAGTFEGSGAGLAIVRRVVERHGGQVWAEESPGGGTTIRASFPAGRDLQ
ncbi:ATP-binding protein [Actinoplanes derwentensis]|uniref:Sensor-like histidine kinase SenX3 n=1 Tax=Actinoplanes derwentensis TaxID=113562 RepID=A0A1H1VY27_9ACTN|nr:ATP-binding protein [Actinoplanes derwentensis]GID83975.1 histidine kinase [Actinoplanes derwentensis]SDS89350.1 Bacteriophytochrome (light-regulated signal transduction histidine kinase) [Actinoplanes derwentensis]